jgi:GT2 family glycosyltransferase
MNRPLSVSAVITYHESPGTIRRVLAALLMQDYPLDQILVVDNGSHDAPAVLLPRDPRVTIISLPDNLGLSHARNVGIAAADSDLVLLLDDDLYLAPDCLRELVNASQETVAAVVCPRIILHPEDAVIQCEGASIHFAGVLILNNKDISIADGLPDRRSVGAFIGACLLMERRLATDLGRFDEDYFFYFEDMELSYRLRALGYAIWLEPRAMVFHDRGSGTPALSFRGAGTYPSRRAFLNLRNRWLTILLHYGTWTLVLLSPALVVYELAACLECIRRGWLLQWFKAIGSLMGRLPRIISQRRRWQRARRVPDREILTGGPLPFTSGFVEPGLMSHAIRGLDGILNGYWQWVRAWL